MPPLPPKIELVKYALTFLLSHLDDAVMEDIRDYYPESRDQLECTLWSMVNELNKRYNQNDVR